MFYVETADYTSIPTWPAPDRIAVPPRPGVPVPGTRLRVRRVTNLMHVAVPAVEIQSPGGLIRTMSMADLDRSARTDPTAQAILRLLGG